MTQQTSPPDPAEGLTVTITVHPGADRTTTHVGAHGDTARAPLPYLRAAVAALQAEIDGFHRCPMHSPAAADGATRADNDEDRDTLRLATEMEHTAGELGPRLATLPDEAHHQQGTEAVRLLGLGAERLRYVLGGLQCSRDACAILAGEPRPAEEPSPHKRCESCGHVGPEVILHFQSGRDFCFPGCVRPSH